MIGREDWITPKGGIKLYKEGLFDLKAIYDTIRSWFEENQYNYQEKDNQTKMKPKGVEVDTKFDAFREVDDYARFHFDIRFLMIEADKVKFKNKLLEKAKIEIIFKAWMELDYKKRWLKSKFSEFLNHIYNNYMIIRKIRKVYETKLYLDLTNIHDKVKEAAELYT
jgi:hypothetical protein